MVVDRQKSKSIVLDIAEPSDGNIGEQEYKKQEKYQEPQRRAREDLEGEGISGAHRHWSTQGSDPQTGGEATADPRKKFDISVQKSAVLRTAKILCRTLKLPLLW
ncbi:hypothetical protein NQD34_009496 [Periophthalmus magnuspinnatus]|nr:hypothetical protein NQD34_009496 [Periophthalmus magnuspinnatus]